MTSLKFENSIAKRCIFVNFIWSYHLNVESVPSLLYVGFVSTGGQERLPYQLHMFSLLFTEQKLNGSLAENVG